MLAICTLYYLGETYPEAATLPVDLVLCIVIVLRYQTGFLNGAALGGL